VGAVVVVMMRLVALLDFGLIHWKNQMVSFANFTGVQN
jgi:hypothetical protein